MRTRTSLKFAALLAPFLFLPAGGSAAPLPGAAAQLPERTGAAVPAPAPPQAAPQGGGNTMAEIAARCLPPAAAEEVIYQSDFHWDYSMPEMMARFGEMYAGPKRLDKRAYWDKAAARLVMPSTTDGSPVRIGLPLVEALRRHIERALELGYADAVFFPDMGHSHLLIPNALWKAKYSKYEISENTRLYEDMLGDPAIKIFYHTAEQLKTLQDNQPISDPQLLFRRANRNIAGPMKPGAELAVLQNPDSAANTVSDVPGYRWWGAGFNFSAQKDGCFAYSHKGATYRFDISLYDLPMKPGSGEDWQ